MRFDFALEHGCASLDVLPCWQRVRALGSTGERLAHGNRTAEILIEIFWRVSAEANRAIVDQRFRVGQAKLEGEAVNDGLEGRAG